MEGRGKIGRSGGESIETEFSLLRKTNFHSFFLNNGTFRWDYDSKKYRFTNVVPSLLYWYPWFGEIENYNI